jgi:hypothetical protein
MTMTRLSARIVPFLAIVLALLATPGSLLAQTSQLERGAELISKANGVVERLQQTTATIQRQLDTARAERNVVKVLFLSEKLSQANASLRSATERRASVKAAVERGDAATASQDSEVLAIIGERSDEFLNAASQTGGEGTGIQRDSNVDVSTDPGMPQPGFQSPTDSPSDPILSDLEQQLKNATTAEERQRIVETFSRNNPDLAGQIAQKASSLFPQEKVALTQAAINGAPDKKTEITTAVTSTLSESEKQQFNNALNPPQNTGKGTPETTPQTSITDSSTRSGSGGTG